MEVNIMKKNIHTILLLIVVFVIYGTVGAIECDSYNIGTLVLDVVAALYLISFFYINRKMIRKYWIS